MTSTPDMLRWRGITDPCPTCGGAGSRVYSSGATWRGGMGTTAGARDVCDTCWGSGDASAPWTNLRALEASERQRIVWAALELLATAAGAGLEVTQAAASEIADEIEKLARGRKARPPYFAEVCAGLARTLRDLAKGAGQ